MGPNLIIRIDCDCESSLPETKIKKILKSVNLFIIIEIFFTNNKFNIFKRSFIKILAATLDPELIVIREGTKKSVHYRGVKCISGASTSVQLR